MRKPGNTEKLPILHILLSVLKNLNTQKSALLKRLAFLAIVMTAFESLADFFTLETSFTILIIYWLTYGMVFTLFAVTCHRVILLGPESVPKYGLHSISLREIRFFGWGFVTYFYLSLITFFSMFPMGFFTFDAESNMYHMMIYSFISIIPGTYLFSRLSILFPATAVDHRKDMEWAWETTKGNGWRLLILLGMIPIFIKLFLGIFAGISLSMDIALNFIGSILAAFEIALLSHAYKFLSDQGVEMKSPISG